MILDSVAVHRDWSACPFVTNLHCASAASNIGENGMVDFLRKRLNVGVGKSYCNHVRPW